MRARWLRHPVYATILALAWMVLQERLTLGDFVMGYALATLIIYLCRYFWTEKVWVRRPGMALRLALTFAREIVVANLQVAWIVIQPRIEITPAFLVLPLKLRDDLLITTLGNMITLTPGTLTVDVAPDRSGLFVHCLSAPDVDAVRRQIKQQFEAPLAESIACSPLPSR
jgi:multicomponent K+:H+ antiporter subunit E